MSVAVALAPHAVRSPITPATPDAELARRAADGDDAPLEERVAGDADQQPEQVASALDLPEATVRTRFFRARGLLREGLSRDIDLALGDAFAFDGARCDRLVAGVRARLAASGDETHR